MSKYGWVILLAAVSAVAGEFRQAKVLDVQLVTVPNNSALGRWAASDGGSAVIPNTVNVITVTLGLADLTYTAQYREQKHFRASDLTIGEFADARVDGDKMVIKMNGKEVKGKILRKAKASQSL